MNFKQQVFIAIGLASLLQVPLMHTAKIPVIPGWHLDIENPVWQVCSMGIFSFSVALLYGFMPGYFITKVYFWLHAFLSFYPVLLSLTLQFWFRMIQQEITSVLPLDGFYNFVFISDWVYVFNQVIFVIVIFAKQYFNRKKELATITSSE